MPPATPWTWVNWAGSAGCSPERFVKPRDAQEVAGLVRAVAGSGRSLRVVGAGHSFTPIVATEGVLVNLDELRGVGTPERVADADGGRATHTVTVGAGIRLRELNRALARHGLAMGNLGDIDHQSVAGAISTGTHGTGGAVAGLSAQVRGVDLVLGSGEAVHADAHTNPELFEAARLGLGTIGVLTAVTLAVEPAYVLEAVEEPWPLDRVLAELQGADDVVARNEHFEFFWFPHTHRALTKRNNRVAADDRPLARLRSLVEDELVSNGVYEAVNRAGALVPRAVPVLNRVSARALGARRFTAPSHEVFVSPRRVRFRESEWAVARTELPAVLAELEAWLARHGRDVSFPVEVRFAAPEDVWLSGAYGRPTAYVAVHQYHRSDHRAYFAAVQAIMTAHGGRPHWGKMHDVDAAYLDAQLPRLADLRRVRAESDPAGVFLNPYTRAVLGLPRER